MKRVRIYGKKGTSAVIIWPALAFFFLVTYLVSCSEGKKDNRSSQSSTEKKDTVGRKPPSSFSDTVLVEGPAAVFFKPDSLQLEKYRVILDTNNFESLKHDCFYQMTNARNVLKKYWPYIKMVEIKDARIILFKSAGGEREYLDLNNQGDPCGIFLFDGYKKAQLVDMMNIDTALRFYFTK